MQEQNIFLPHQCCFSQCFLELSNFMKEKYSFSQYCSIRWAKQEQLLVKQGLISKIIIYELLVQMLICQTLYSAAAQSPKQSSLHTGVGGGGGRLTADGNRRPEMLDPSPGRAFGQEKILDRAFLPSGAQSSFVRSESPISQCFRSLS